MEDFYWLNEDSRKFLRRGYLLEGVEPEERVRQIAEHAEDLLGVEGFADKFYDYMGNGWFSLASPVWSNFGLKRGLPISCLTADSWINTRSEGGTQIKDLEMGDEVLTHKGRYKKVIDKQVRQSEDDLYELKVKTRMTPIKITGNHPVLTNRGWVRVDELDDKNDFIATNNNIEWQEKEFNVVLDHKKTKENQYDEKNIGGSYEVDSELAWALGLWFAEGSISRNQSASPNGIRITMGMGEEESLERWLSIITETFDVNGNIYEGGTSRNGKESRWLNVNVNSGALGRYFENMFGTDCKTKNIPVELKEMPKNLLKRFFEGFYKGDGRKTRKQQNFTISNPKLAMSLYEIGLKCGYKMGLQMQAKAGKLSTTRHVYQVNIYCNQGRCLARNNARSGIEFHDGLRYAPFKLKKLDHNEPVYDITVEDDHSFSVSGVVVHNCFGSYLDDTMESILYTQAEVGMMTKMGGGTSGYFGDLRPRGSEITDNGKSNGSYSFTQLFDTLIDVVSQGETRRGHFAGYIDIDHGDADEWFNIQTEGDNVQDMYYAVVVSDEWMEDMIAGDPEKRKRWAQVIEARINLGVPYIIFGGNVNNNKPQVYKDNGYKIHASNLCMTGDQRVVTSQGYLTAEELYNRGNNLTLFDGDQAVSSSKMKLREKNADVYKITLSNGLEHKVTAYHGLPVYRGRGKYDRVEAKNINEGDRIVVQKNKGLFGNLHKPKEAFLCGMYQSDGTQTEDAVMLDVWEQDFDVLEEIEEAVDYVYNVHGLNEYEVSNQFGPTGKTRARTTPRFRDCVVSNSDVQKKRLKSSTLKKALQVEKGRVPDWMWEADEKTQWKYVKGLLISDGTVHMSESRGNPIQVAYADINRDFLKELQLLFNNLGLTSQIRLLRKGGKRMLPDGNGGMKAYDTKDCYRLIISNKPDALVLEEHTGFLSRKNIEIENRDYRDNTKKAYAVESIEYVGKEDVYCPTVDTDEHVFVAQGMLTFNCSEIMLPSNAEESFVCCLSSINLRHYEEWKDTDAVETITMFLDAVMQEFIDRATGVPFMERAVNFARNHRAIGIGTLGWHSYLQSNMIPFDSMEASMKNAEIFKFIKERSYQASEKMADMFGEPSVMEGYGRRNATTMAVAPTKSSSFILGQVSPSIEPFKSNYFVRDGAKLKATFRNPFLQELLQERGKDTNEVWDSIAHKDGSVQHLDFLTDHEKDVFRTFAEIPQMGIIKQAGQRQKYIDQSQSLNIAVDPSNTSVKQINALYIEAWKLGVKSLYYQHSVNAAQKFSRNILECRSCEG